MTVRGDFNASPAESLAAQAGFTQPVVRQGRKRTLRLLRGRRGTSSSSPGRRRGPTPTEPSRSDCRCAAIDGSSSILPAEHAFATLQRAPWFTGSGIPTVWLHDGSTAERMPLPSMEATIIAVRERDAGAPRRRSSGPQ